MSDRAGARRTRRARRGAAATLVAAGLGLAVPAPASAVVANPHPLASALSKALAASRAQRSVFWRGTSSSNGATVIETTNAGVSRGTQTVTVKVGARNAGSIAIKLFGNTVYMRGTTAASLLFQGFTPAAASAEVNRWIAIPSSQSFFQVIAAGLTVKSTVEELNLTGRLHRARRTRVLGHRVLGIVGTLSLGGVSGPATLYVPRSGRPLPLEETTSGGGPGVMTLGRWGERIHVGSPPEAVGFRPSWIQPTNGGAPSAPSAPIAL